METMKAVRVHSYGGPEVLQFEDTPRHATRSQAAARLRIVSRFTS